MISCPLVICEIQLRCRVYRQCKAILLVAVHISVDAYVMHCA
jgi:hypothetical protein